MFAYSPHWPSHLHQDLLPVPDVLGIKWLTHGTKGCISRSFRFQIGYFLNLPHRAMPIQGRVFCILGVCSKNTARSSRRFHRFRPWKFASAEGVESILPYIAASNGPCFNKCAYPSMLSTLSTAQDPFCGHFLTHKWHDGSAQPGTTSSQPW